MMRWVQRHIPTTNRRVMDDGTIDSSAGFGIVAPEGDVTHGKPQTISLEVLRAGIPGLTLSEFKAQPVTAHHQLNIASDHDYEITTTT